MVFVIVNCILTITVDTALLLRKLKEVLTLTLMQMIRAQLDSIDDAWKQPRFDSLPYVVEVITSPNIEAAVERLRETRDAIEEIVDGVVRIYHNGFNKAIHNYSQVCW